MDDGLWLNISMNMYNKIKFNFLFLVYTCISSGFN